MAVEVCRFNPILAGLGAFDFFYQPHEYLQLAREPAVEMRFDLSDLVLRLLDRFVSRMPPSRLAIF